MSFQKIAFTALILGLIFVNACRIEPNTWLGDLTSFDTAIKFNGSGHIQLPKVSFGGSGFTFELDVNTGSSNGCLYSAGDVGKPNFVEIRLDGGRISFTRGTETLRTPITPFKVNRWQQISVTLDNKSGEAMAYINGEDHPFTAPTFADKKGLLLSPRDGKVGACPHGPTLNGAVDNLIIFNTAQTQEQIQWTHRQFFPFVLSENVVVYYPFNDVVPGAGGVTSGLIGGGALTNLDANMVGGPVSDLKANYAKQDVIDTFCSHRGISLQGKTGADAIPPFMGVANGGATQTVACQDKQGQTTFVVNQYWTEAGGISQMTVKTSAHHFWRISAPGLQVEHRTWGGWNILPRASDTIEIDHTTYKFTDDAVLIQAGVHGFVKITEKNGLLSYDIGVNTGNCALIGAPTRTSWCDHLAIEEFIYDFSTEPVPEMPLGFKSRAPGVAGLDPVLACPPPSTQYRPDLVKPPPPPPPPPAKLPPPPDTSVPVDPCADYKNAQPQLYAEFKRACDALFTAGGSAHEKCMRDSCVTGTTTVDKPDCLSEKLKAATDSEYVMDPKCVTEECPNNCSGNGNCVADTETSIKSCVCNAGFVGKSCDVPESYPCFKASSPAGLVPVDPTLLVDRAGVARPTSYLTAANLGSILKGYAVEDTTLIYLVATQNSVQGRDYSLVIVNNNENGSGDGSIDIALTGASGATVVYHAQGSATAAGPLSNMSFKWSFNSMAGAVIKNLPADFQGTLTLSGKSGVRQVLIGTAHGTNKASGILAVHKYTKNSIEINGSECQNNCENIDSCDACSAQPNCGWCVEGARCLPGDRAGPHFYGQCKNWRFTFDDDVSRRLTQEYAHPVSPGATTVFLVEAGSSGNVDLPLEVNVAVGAPEKIQWDVAFLNAWDNEHKGTWSSQITTLLQTLTHYPNIGVALNSHDASGFKVIKVVSNPRDYYWFGQHVTSAPTTKANNALAGIIGIADKSKNAIGWRQHSRKILIITADSNFSGETNVDKVRAALMSRDIIPVFVVTSNVRSTYQAVVDQLGFGFVQTLSSRSGNIVSATTRAIQLAAGHAATFYDDAHTGHLNTQTWADHKDSFHMFGLKDNFMARFPVPVHREQGKAIAKTKLHMPAFGSATIENILSEKPTAMAMPLHSSGFEGELQFIELKGRSWQNFAKTTARITSLPGDGELYQVIETVNGPARGNLMKVGDAVTDPTGRVAYLAPDTRHGPNFATFTFHVSDGCVNSNEVTITIDVLNTNEAPVAEMLPPSDDEDVAQVIVLGGNDIDGDKFTAIITESLHELNADGTTMTGSHSGTLYQYDDQILNSRAEAEARGVVIDTSSGPVQVLNSNMVVYWPRLHTNSHADFGKTPELLVKPCFNYKVVEDSTTEKFESDVARVPIDIRAVNDAPFIYGDSDPNYIYQWDPVPTTEDFCFENCVFQEDFGHKYPWDAEYKYIHLGGGDVEKDTLDFLITSIQCDENAVLENDIQGRRLEVWDPNSTSELERGVIEVNEPGTLIPAIRFRPGPDANNINGGFNDFYCKFSYKVRDVHGAISAKEHTVTISVTPVDDPVRLAAEDQLVVALEEQRKTFVIDAVDPENKEFTTVIQGCKSETRGVFTACLDAQCLNTETIDCVSVNAGNHHEIVRTTKRQVPSGFGSTLTFTSGPITSLTEGLGYQALQVAFKGADGVVGDSFFVNVNVISLNEAPLLFVNPSETEPVPAAETLTVSIPSQTAFAPLLRVTDEDVNQGDMTVSIDFTPRDGSTMVLDDSVLVAEKKDIWDLTGSVVFSGKLAEVNRVLESFQFKGTKDFGSYTINIDVNDNGYTGQCGSEEEFNAGTLAWSGSVCRLSAKTTINVEYVDQTLINAAIIAGAGVGVLGLTAIGAVAAAKFFNKEAASGEFAPWDEFEGDEPSVANPLYESATVGGTSQIYQDANSGYVEMGSGGSYL